LTAALDGHGRLVLLAGEAGIGKTRLAERLAHDARRAGPRADRPLLRRRRRAGVLAVGDDASGVVAAPETARVRAWLRGNAGVIAQVVPDVAGDGDTAPAAQGLDADAARFRFFDAVVTTIARAPPRIGRS
jgi:hypothetical protein